MTALEIALFLFFFRQIRHMLFPSKGGKHADPEEQNGWSGVYFSADLAFSFVSDTTKVLFPNLYIDLAR